MDTDLHVFRFACMTSTAEYLGKMSTGWRRCTRCLLLQVSFRKRAIDYRALSQKITYIDKASHASSPPCIIICSPVSTTRYKHEYGYARIEYVHVEYVHVRDALGHKVRHYLQFLECAQIYIYMDTDMYAVRSRCVH